MYEKIEKIRKNIAPNLNEQATKQALIMPFLHALGYNIFDPNEVAPEYPADFKDKYKEKVDFALIYEGKPRIAIECKPIDTDLDNHRDQLRRYFNAATDIKVGILTNGVEYRFYTDTDKPNIMDISPFFAFKIDQISEDDDIILDSILKFKKEEFNHEQICLEAQDRLVQIGLIRFFRSIKLGNIDIETVQAILKLSGFEGRVTKNIAEKFKPITSLAIRSFIANEVMGIVKDRTGIDVSAPNEIEENNNGIVTTEKEMKLFMYIQNRLRFLVEDDKHYDAISHLQWKDYKGFFKIYYKVERKGLLLQFFDEGEGWKLKFANSDETIDIINLKDIDNQLVNTFMFLVKNLGR